MFFVFFRCLSKIINKIWKFQKKFKISFFSVSKNSGWDSHLSHSSHPHFLEKPENNAVFKPGWDPHPFLHGRVGWPHPCGNSCDPLALNTTENPRGWNRFHSNEHFGLNTSSKQSSLCSVETNENGEILVRFDRVWREKTSWESELDAYSHEFDFWNEHENEETESNNEYVRGCDVIKWIFN